MTRRTLLLLLAMPLVGVAVALCFRPGAGFPLSHHPSDGSVNSPRPAAHNDGQLKDTRGVTIAGVEGATVRVLHGSEMKPATFVVKDGKWVKVN